MSGDLGCQEGSEISSVTEFHAFSFSLPNKTGKQKLAITLILILLFLIGIDVFMGITKHTKYNHFLLFLKTGLHQIKF